MKFVILIVITAYYWAYTSPTFAQNNNSLSKTMFKDGTYEYIRGDSYEFGYEKGGKDEIKAYELYFKAAQKGNAKAQFKIGSNYLEMQNYKKAHFWLSKAAEQNNVDAQNTLGIMYSFGQGVLQNDRTAVGFYTKAAKGGDIIGQINLSQHLASGQGVTQNYIQAYAWISAVLARNISGKAQKMILSRRNELTVKMTKTQIENAQILSEDYYKKYVQEYVSAEDEALRTKLLLDNLDLRSK